MDWYANGWRARAMQKSSVFLETSIKDEALSRMMREMDRELKAGCDIESQETTVLLSLFKALYAAAHMEQEGNKCETSKEFHRFYCLSVPNVLDVFLHEPARKKEPSPSGGDAQARNAEMILYCLALLMDVLIFMLQTLTAHSKPERVDDAISVLRTLCSALDKSSFFQLQRKHTSLPDFIVYRPHQHTKPLFRKEEEPCECTCGKQGSLDSENSTYESYGWIRVLWEVFGGNNVLCAESDSGYEALLDNLSSLHQQSLDLNEVVLLFLSRAGEFLTDYTLSCLSEYCLIYMKQILTRLSTCPRSSMNFGTVSLILKYVRDVNSMCAVIHPPEITDGILTMVILVQKRMRDEVQELPVGKSASVDSLQSDRESILPRVFRKKRRA